MEHRQRGREVVVEGDQAGNKREESLCSSPEGIWLSAIRNGAILKDFKYMNHIIKLRF